MTIPAALYIARTARAEAQEIYAGMRHTNRLTEKGAKEKWRKVVEPCGAKHTHPHVEAILQDYRWPYAEIEECSSVDFRKMAVWKHPRCLLSLFEADDIIWSGEVYEAQERNFRTRDEWLAQTNAMPPLTCPSTFHRGVYTRSQTNAKERKFPVVESDTLDRDTVGGIFRWLREANGLSLRAIVDTGGKSLHAWFDYPGDGAAADLKLVLPPLGCDRRMFVPTQPCRMPGVARAQDRFQRLIYLN